MTLVFILLSAQALLGAFDNLWHHEITEQLPSKRSASGELALHSARELIYAVILLQLGWLELHGMWALLLAAALIVEIIITMADFLLEDRTRRLLQRAASSTGLSVTLPCLTCALPRTPRPGYRTW